ncbi:hypothetical protein EXIGLDRAFT_101333 [Exidia glandulosa HHB12029]|uniref:Uncharacterized protein n=1 Tax=Exidia glandulosa HHB12029 TaxID=1314781 RepID=A0A166AEX9_EXIGL|nr:hypothetical protein EXIGLDRAFT_101333 [Exidia glandulosa HHB12029]
MCEDIGWAMAAALTARLGSVHSDEREWAQSGCTPQANLRAAQVQPARTREIVCTRPLHSPGQVCLSERNISVCKSTGPTLTLNANARYLSCGRERAARVASASSKGATDAAPSNEISTNWPYVSPDKEKR